MILLLRLGALLLNVAAFALPVVLLDLPWFLALLPFPLLAWACARLPPAEPGSPEIEEEAAAIARLLGAPAPRFVRRVPGWTAAAARARLSYGLIVGSEIGPGHRRAVLAHEIAHAREGDLLWEPFTDGPARLLLPAVQKAPLLALPLLPFFLLAVPLARRTELLADRIAAAAVPSYPEILTEVAARWGGRSGLLYPSLRRRRAEVARHSLEGPPRDFRPE